MEPGSSVRVVTITGSSSELLEPNDSRIGLIVPSSNTGRFTISFAGAAVLDQGINIPVGVLPLQLIGQYWNCLLKRSLTAIAAVSPTVIQLIELLEIHRKRVPDSDYGTVDSQGNIIYVYRHGVGGNVERVMAVKSGHDYVLDDYK